MLATSINPLDNLLAGLAQAILGENVFYPQYREHPVEFARKILQVEWTEAVQDIAKALLTHDKIVVPAGHAVGKTHGVAGIVLWWLSTRKTIVVTTAPTWRQVVDLIWREIRYQHRHAIKAIPSKPITVKWDIEEDWYAIGLSTNKPERFQGYHSGELLVILDEACGVERFIWESIEDGLAVSEGNKILAIGNPTDPTSRFAQVCRSSDWKHIKLSCLEHPNVVQGKSVIRKAVSVKWVRDRVQRWCTPYNPLPDEVIPADVFEFEGEFYIPNDMFRIRILGDFPIEGGRQIIPLSYIHRAFYRDPVEPHGANHIGLDIARFGEDNSVLIGGSTNGVVTALDVWQGFRTTTSAGRAKYWAAKMGDVMNIAVDGIGYGAGVVDELADSNYPVLDVNVAEKAYDVDSYPLLRDELYFNLAEAFKMGQIDLSRMIRWEEQITEELNAIKFDYTKKGQRKVSPKKDIKEEIGHSPDFADALMLWWSHIEVGFISGEVVEKKESWDDF